MHYKTLVVHDVRPDLLEWPRLCGKVEVVVLDLEVLSEPERQEGIKCEVVVVRIRHVLPQRRKTAAQAGLICQTPRTCAVNCMLGIKPHKQMYTKEIKPRHTE